MLCIQTQSYLLISICSCSLIIKVLSCFQIRNKTLNIIFIYLLQLGIIPEYKDICFAKACNV